MGLKVIGAGFGRTGTESMKQALEMIGMGPCYHMYEVLPHKDRVTLWRGVAAGNTPDWDAVFDGFHSTVDWPAAAYWRDLVAHFPDAKVLLTVRDPDSWYASMEKTILKIVRSSVDEETLGIRLIRDLVFEGNVEDRDHVISIYERNIADVQAHVPSDRLLTYELASGWGPLCAFLDCDVPEEPYPSGNEETEFHVRLKTYEAKRRGD